MNFFQNIIDLIRGKSILKIEINKNENFSKKKRVSCKKEKELKPCKTIVTTSAGFAYSGTSTLIGFLSEFDNVMVFGNCDKVYSKNQKRGGYETRWFIHSGFFDLTDSFLSNNLIEADMAIKLFVRQIYRAYKNKSLLSWDKATHFYNDNFLKANLEYLKNVLDFNEYDLSVLENNPIPPKFNSMTDKTYENCSFMQEKGVNQYLFYRFKNISKEEFDDYTNKYLTSLFAQFKGRDIVVFDKIIRLDEHKKINYFMKDKPIKQICFLRDPRDEFLSTYRFSYKKAEPLTSSAREWIDYYKGKASTLFENKDENILILKFEDFVFNYDKVANEIMNFLELKEENHIAPKTIFEPEISKVNIGAWKYFIDQDLMKQIGEELSEYCYNS